MTLLILVGILLAIVFGVRRYVASLDSQQKTAIKDGINEVFVRAEREGRFPRHPAFETDYLRDYPGLQKIEENYSVIREECEALMQRRENLVPMASLEMETLDTRMVQEPMLSFGG